VSELSKEHASVLLNWIDDESIGAATELIEECPAEVLYMVAALVNLDISTRDHAHDEEADGFILHAEGTRSRADMYHDTINAICEVWNDDPVRTESKCETPDSE
jgi:hypothetical protein